MEILGKIRRMYLRDKLSLREALGSFIITFEIEWRLILQYIVTQIAIRRAFPA